MKRKKLLALIMGLALMLVLILVGTAAAGNMAESFVPQAAPEAVHTVCLAGPPTCDYSTIQDAVTAAGDSDVVKVAAGTYTGINNLGGLAQVVYVDKPLYIEGGYTTGDWSYSDPEANPTIIDAQSAGRGVVVTGTNSIYLTGLQITGGSAAGLGGGPWSYDGVGGGLYVANGDVYISHCQIYGNRASDDGWGGGGGVYIWNSPDSHVYDTTIYGNTASNSSLEMGEGGGLAFSGSDVWLGTSIIRDNVANAMTGNGIGGGLYMEDGNSTVAETVIRHNTAGASGWGGGGGIWFGLNDTSTIENSVLMDNVGGATADSPGAGLASEWSYPSLYHVTFHGNSGGDGSGINAFFSSAVTVTNAIVVSHSVGITVESGSSAVVDGVLWYGNSLDTGGLGGLSLSNESTGNPLFESDGYHIQYGSAAMDVGVNAGVFLDIDMDYRPYASGYDLGADEWVSPPITEPIDPETGGTLIFTDTRGLTTTVEVPPGAVSETIVLVFETLPILPHPSLPGHLYAGPGFTLDALCPAPNRVFLPVVVRNYTPGAAASAAQMLPALDQDTSLSLTPTQLVPCPISFLLPSTVTVRYADEDVIGIGDESSLALYLWEDSTWLDAANTCVPPSTYGRDLAGNALSLPICHLTEFSIQGE